MQKPKDSFGRHIVMKSDA